MPQSYPKAFKNCSVCNFWGGSRQVDAFGMNVTVDASTTKGKCLHQGGSWKGQDMPASSTCQQWQAWGALKLGRPESREPHRPPFPNMLAETKQTEATPCINEHSPRYAFPFTVTEMDMTRLAIPAPVPLKFRTLRIRLHYNPELDGFAYLTATVRTVQR